MAKIFKLAPLEIGLVEGENGLAALKSGGGFKDRNRWNNLNVQ